MKQQGIISDFLYQVFALIIAVIVVHAIYVAVIRPNADLQMEQQAIMQAADPDFVSERSLYVVMKDFEQETCIILMLWAMSIIGLKIYRNRKEKRITQSISTQSVRRHEYLAGRLTGLCAAGAGATCN